MLLQQLAQGFAEDAHAAAVDYADAGQAGEEGAVDELLDSREASSTVWPITLISLGTFAPSFSSETEMPRARAAFTGVSAGLGGCADEHFGDVVAGDFHFHRAHFDFEMIVVDFADDAGADGRWISA